MAFLGADGWESKELSAAILGQREETIQFPERLDTLFEYNIMDWHSDLTSAN